MEMLLLIFQCKISISWQTPVICYKKKCRLLSVNFFQTTIVRNIGQFFMANIRILKPEKLVTEMEKY